MKLKSKKHLETLCISLAMSNRPNKTAIGMSYTNERRARHTRHSFCIAAFVDSNKYRLTDVARTLSVRGTTDKLARMNCVKRYKIKKFRTKRELKAKQLLN